MSNSIKIQENVEKREDLIQKNENIKENERVDINVLKKKLKETESKEFKKNIFIMLILFSLLAIVGIYLTL
tara:strand:+ start:246 stop:458 length:213 start_codon:yes stop_codon:yes gene_type:complete